MTTQTARVGTQEVVITPREAEDGSFVASVRGGRHAEQAFAPADWTDPRVRLDAARTNSESFAITRNNQNLNQVAKAIDAEFTTVVAMGRTVYETRYSALRDDRGDLTGNPLQILRPPTRHQLLIDQPHLTRCARPPRLQISAHDFDLRQLRHVGFWLVGGWFLVVRGWLLVFGGS